MHKFSLSLFYIFILCSHLLILQYSCGSIIEEGDPAILDLIHQNIYSNPTADPTQPERTDFDIYIDYSDGMQAALNHHADFFYKILDLFNQAETSYYRIGATSEPKNMTLVELKNDFDPRSPRSFNDRRSEIDIALNRITRQFKPAVLITDFELVKTGNSREQFTNNGRKVRTYISLNNWAIKNFDEWLLKGRRLFIYALPFTKNDYSTQGDQQQQLYFMVFLPDQKSHHSPYQKVINRIDKIDQSVKKLSFAQDDIELVSENSHKDNGGSNNIIIPEMIILKPDYEYYQFEFEQLSDYVVLDNNTTDKQIVSGFRLLNNSCFTDLEFELVTHKITSLYKALKEESTNTTNNQSVFSPHRLERVSNYFVLHQNSDTLGITFHPTFNQLLSDQEIFSIGIYLKGGNLNLPTNEIQEYLSWYYTKGGFRVESLSGSLTETTNRMQLKRKHLLTLYLDFIIR